MRGGRDRRHLSTGAGAGAETEAGEGEGLPIPEPDSPPKTARAANDLEARRLAVCDEVGGGLCLNDEKFKQITGGGDTMAARRLHQDARAIDTSQAKLLALADPPFFEASSCEAFRHRLAVVAMPCRFSFDPNEVDGVAVFPAQEPAALDAVLEEKAGEFFAFFVQGAIRYYREGVADEPPTVLEATASFFQQQDPVALFFEQAPRYRHITISGEDFGLDRRARPERHGRDECQDDA